MNPIFKKLNFKGQSPIYVINAPVSFKKDMDEMKSETEIKTTLSKARELSFFLAFVTKQKEVDDLAKSIAPIVAGDGIVWFSYPKGSSKKYACEFNRDNGWQELGNHGFEPVRMVAIDDDWSALRFRRAEHIRNMTRGFAMSEKGKEKVAAKKVAPKKDMKH